MNAKLLKYYETMLNFGKADYITNPELLHELISYLLDYNFDIAIDVWEYILVKEADLINEPKFTASFGDEIFKLFLAKSEPKACKLLTDSPQVRQIIYQYSPTAAEGLTFDFIVQLVASGKTEAADEILKAFFRNAVTLKSQADAMREMVERIIIELLKKAAGKKKIELPKKISALLMNYITKIKGPERALLEQKIKEVS